MVKETETPDCTGMGYYDPESPYSGRDTKHEVRWTEALSAAQLAHWEQWLNEEKEKYMKKMVPKEEDDSA